MMLTVECRWMNNDCCLVRALSGQVCRVRSDVSSWVFRSKLCSAPRRPVNGVKCLGEVHSTTHVAILSICHWLPVEEYQVSSFMASLEPHWLSRKAWLPLIWMSSSWKMTQVNAVLESCTTTWLQTVCLCTGPYVGGATITISLKSGTIKGMPPKLELLATIPVDCRGDSILTRFCTQWVSRGENLSSKNQKRPHGFKYFQVARNLFLDSIFWNSLNHMWNLIHIKDKKEGALTHPNCEVVSEDMHRTLKLQGPWAKIFSSVPTLSHCRYHCPLKAAKSFHQNGCWAGSVLAWGHTATHGPRWDWNLGFLDSQPVLFILWVALSNAHKDWAPVSALETVVGSRVVITDLTALVLWQCLSHSCREHL